MVEKVSLRVRRAGGAVVAVEVAVAVPAGTTPGELAAALAGVPLEQLVYEVLYRGRRQPAHRLIIVLPPERARVLGLLEE